MPLDLFRYLSSIAGVLLSLQFGSLHSQRAALLCPLLYHATIAACEPLLLRYPPLPHVIPLSSPDLLFSSTAMINAMTNAEGARNHAAFAAMAAYAYCTLK